MRLLFYWLLGAFSFLGIVLPSFFMSRYVLHTCNWEKNQHPLIMLCLTVWILAGLVLCYLTGKQTLEILAKAEEIERRKVEENKIREDQKQVEAEKVRLTILEKLVSLQKDKPSIDNIKELFELIKSQSQNPNA